MTTLYQLSELDLRRFFDKVIVDLDTGCWLWQAHKDKNGYGSFWLNGQMRDAHRVSYLHFVGPVPSGEELGHYNGDTCAFFEHVRPISRAQNVREGYGTSETHCGKGHPRIPSNTHVDGNGSKHCKACDRIATRRHYGYESCLGCGYAVGRCRCEALWKS